MIPTLETIDWSKVKLCVLMTKEQPCGHCGRVLLRDEPIILAQESLTKKKWWLEQDVVYCDPICKELQFRSIK